MATTKIWSIKGRLDHVLDYAENEDKTVNPDYSGVDVQGLRDVMDYACQDYKTEKQHFVSGINCSPETARQEMLDTKAQYGKSGGIIAFHAYQSFAEGEVTPELAHEIGMKLAQEMWGDRFEVIVATHLDKAHIHNHFVLNSVSFADGYKYYDNNENYDRFRVKSDKLCEQYRLSVIDEPQRGRRPSYAVYLAEGKGEPTYRSLIRADVDKAIAEALTDKQFFANLKKMGYEYKVGKYITVRPQGKDYGLRLARNFGEDYTLEAIKRRILTQSAPQRQRLMPEPPTTVKRVQFKGNIKTMQRITGFRALYLRYFYLLGGRPQWQMRTQNRPPTAKKILFIFREDIRKMHELSNEMKLLGRNHIDCAEQLSSYKEGLTVKIAELTDTRQHLRYKARSVKDDPTLVGLKAEIAGLSAELGTLRKEVKLCDSIEARTAVMREKIRMAAEIRGKEQEQIKSQTKEEQTYAKRRRSR
jgi:hypothetical protein